MQGVKGPPLTFNYREVIAAQKYAQDAGNQDDQPHAKSKTVRHRTAQIFDRCPAPNYHGRADAQQEDDNRHIGQQLRAILPASDDVDQHEDHNAYGQNEFRQ